MANLKKCKACGAAISSKAPTCPQCGEPQKRKPVGCGGAIAILFVVGIIAAIIAGDPAGTSKGTAPEAALTPEQQRQQKIDAQFSGWDGAHRSLERSVKAGLKDPDSYQHIESRYGDKGDYILVRMEFRAKNSFGGYVVNVAEGKYDLDGNAIEPPKVLN